MRLSLNFKVKVNGLIGLQKQVLTIALAGWKWKLKP